MCGPVGPFNPACLCNALFFLIRARTKKTGGLINVFFLLGGILGVTVLSADGQS